jgi:hypothetical protein
MITVAAIQLPALKYQRKPKRGQAGKTRDTITQRNAPKTPSAVNDG